MGLAEGFSVVFGVLTVELLTLTKNELWKSDGTLQGNEINRIKKRLCKSVEWTRYLVSSVNF